MELVYPEEQKLACVLLLDSSGSMSGDKIDQLNEGIRLFKEEVVKDALARKRVEVAIVTFGDSVNVIQNCAHVENMEVPAIVASGSTPMGEAILKAAAVLEERKSLYKQAGTSYYRPWIIMITDGEPTDMHPGDDRWRKAVDIIQSGEKDRKFVFYSIGVDQANMEMLKQLSPAGRVPLMLKGVNFRELFLWLSKSMAVVSNSKPNETVKLPPPGWADYTG